MMITHHYHKEFRAKGIPEALIPLVSKQHRKDITSSTNLKEHKCFPNESRRDVKVDKIFKRLKAEYDKETDLYTYKYQHD